MAFGDADLNMMTTDVFAAAVTYGVQVGEGILDKQDQLVGAAEGTAFSLRTTTLILQTGDFTGLAQDTAITVGGTAYQIRDIAVRDDGNITLLTLAGP